MRFRNLICILGCFLSACGSSKKATSVHEDISDIKYQVNRISSPLDEKPYRVNDEFNFLDKYSGDAKVIRSDIEGKCISDVNKSDVKPVNATINSNKFLLGVVLTAEFLVTTDRETSVYRCHLTVSGTTDIGSQVDVPIILEWHREDFLGIDFSVKKNETQSAYPPEFSLNIDKDFVLETLEEYSQNPANPSIRLVCNLDPDSPTTTVINSLNSNGLIKPRGDNNILHIVFYIFVMYMEEEENSLYNRMKLTDCVVTNNKFNTPEFQWSQVFDFYNLLDSVVDYFEDMDEEQIDRISFWKKYL